MGYQALLFCPDQRTAGVVAQVLSELEFGVEPGSEPFAVVKKLMAQHFDAIVVDCDNEQNATLLFKSARNSGPNQSSLTVAVVEGQTGVAKAFRLGANLVLTKPINVEQSKGTLRVARSLLRKAEAAKSAATASASAEQAARPADSNVDSAGPFPPVPPVQKPAPFPGQQTALSIPAATTASAFELEEEPAAALGPAEATLIEYTPAPPTAKPVSAREYPWQPVSKPLAEPMASALRRAAEAAGKADDSLAPGKGTLPQAAIADAAKGKESWPVSSMSSSQGAATAPAAAKETWPSVKTRASEPAATVTPAPKRQEDKPEPVFKKALATAAVPAIEAPIFSSLSDTQDGEASHKKTFLIAAIGLLLVAAGYFGWTKMHPAGSQPAGQQHFAPVHAPAAPAAIPQAASSNQETGAPSQSAPPEVSETQGQKEVAATSTAKTPSGKPSAAIPAPDPTAKTAPAAKTREPIAVKNELPKKSNTQAAGEEPTPPPVAGGFGLASNPASNLEDKGITGIVSTTPLHMPHPAPQALKISQGISQGMLLKQVQPNYPPQAMQMHLQGAVQLQASIGKDGSIANVKQLSGDAVLGRAAMDAVRQWKYKPYYLNGEPVEVQTQVTVNFKLP